MVTNLLAESVTLYDCLGTFDFEIWNAFPGGKLSSGLLWVTKNCLQGAINVNVGKLNLQLQAGTKGRSWGSSELREIFFVMTEKLNFFMHLLPSDLLKTNETFFLMLLVDCLALFLYLKSMWKEFCHIHIQQSQYLMAVQKTCHSYMFFE